MRSPNFWKVFSACVFLLSFCLSSEAVSVRAVDCEVRDVLLGIAAESGVGLLLDDSVSGKITLRVDGLNFDDALQLIADAKGLQYQKKRDNLYIVGLHYKRQKKCVYFPRSPFDEGANLGGRRRAFRRARKERRARFR